MEDFKDVMLSEVPVPSRQYGGYQANMHSVGTFENYKVPVTSRCIVVVTSDF